VAQAALVVVVYAAKVAEDWDFLVAVAQASLVVEGQVDQEAVVWAALIVYYE